ncbi:MAG: DUF697 domain-containing protein [Lewinellaceae bacterium]|nr:DUF697 domain-containing protein [Lewinellaceae bacterium]
MLHEDKTAKANEIIRNHVGFSMGAALVPFPGADLLAVSAVQLNMLRQLAQLYNLGFIDSLGKNVISAVVGSSAARLGASLIKAIPGVGTVIGELSMPVLSGASTFALGKALAVHFHSGGTLEDLDIRKAKSVYDEEIVSGKDIADEISKMGPAMKSPADEAIDKIRKLSELKSEGVLSEEEFTQLKTRLLEQI